MRIKNPLPLVSILIPTYNQPEYFRIALKSAIAQDYPNIEILVSDDSTDDRVFRVFEEYKDCGRDLKYFKHEEKIPERSYNEMFNFENLLEHSRGEYINFLMHDDLYMPDKISKMMKVYFDDVHQEIAVVTSARYQIDWQGYILNTWSPNTFGINMLDPKGLTIIPGRSAGNFMLIECLNYIGELTTTLMRKKMFYSKFRAPNSPRYFSAGPYHSMMTDVTRFLEAFQHGHLAFITEPLSAFRTGLDFQDTNDPNSRISCVMSWYFLATLAYLQGYYIRTFEDFVKSAKKNTIYTLPAIFSWKDGKINYKLDDKILHSLADIIPTLEYAKSEEYELLLSHVIERLLIYPETRRIMEKYVAKNSQGLWQRRY